MNKIKTIYLLDNTIQGYYTVEILRSNDKSRIYEVNYKHSERINQIDALLRKHCAIYDIVRYHVSTLTVYLPIRFPSRPFPSLPVKTKPITGLNVSTKAGVYRVEFYRDNALRSYKIMNWKRIGR